MSDESEVPDALIEFLWVLCRDHVSFGVVEGILRDHVEAHGFERAEFCDKDMEQYIRKLAARLFKPPAW